MPIELTDADRAEIVRCTGTGANPTDEAIYRAGIDAGLERAARVCENVTAQWPIVNETREQCVKDCADAIRALIK